MEESELNSDNEQGVGTFRVDGDLISALAGHLPVATVILLLEHIAISKCTSS